MRSAEETLSYADHPRMMIIVGLDQPLIVAHALGIYFRRSAGVRTVAAE